MVKAKASTNSFFQQIFKNLSMIFFAKIQIELEILFKEEYILLTFLNLNFLPQDYNILWTPKVSPGIFEISIVKFLFASFFSLSRW